MGTKKLRKIGLGGVSGVRILSWVSNLREKDGLKNKTRILFIHSFIHSSKKLCYNLEKVLSEKVSINKQITIKLDFHSTDQEDA